MAAPGSDDLAYRFQYAPTNELAQIVDFGIDSPQHIDAARSAVMELLRRSSSVFQVFLDDTGFRTTVVPENSLQETTIQYAVNTLWDTYHESAPEHVSVYDFRNLLIEQRLAHASEAYTERFTVDTTEHYLTFLKREHVATTTPGVPRYLNILSGLTVYGQMQGGQTDVSFYEKMSIYMNNLTTLENLRNTLSPFDTVHAFLLQHNLFHTYYAPIHEYLMRFAIKAPDTEYTVYRSWLHILMVSYLHDAVHESQQKYSDIPAPWLAAKVHEALPTVDRVLDAVEYLQPVLIASYA